MPGIFGKEISELTSAMNFRQFRQGILSSNIANVDTPGYKAKESTFEEQLNTRIQMTRTSEEHIPSSRPSGTITFRVEEDPYSRIGNDSNTVDIDREMMKLNQNQLLYEASATVIQAKISAIKDAIRSMT